MKKITPLEKIEGKRNATFVTLGKYIFTIYFLHIIAGWFKDAGGEGADPVTPRPASLHLSAGVVLHRENAFVIMGKYKFAEVCKEYETKYTCTWPYAPFTICGDIICLIWHKEVKGEKMPGWAMACILIIIAAT